MIYATGDTHGDFWRFGKNIFFEQDRLSKDDYVVVCEDFGIWDNSAHENYWLDWLNDKSFTALFVTGNHSNYNLYIEILNSVMRGHTIVRLLRFIASYVSKPAFHASYIYFTCF